MRALSYGSGVSPYQEIGAAAGGAAAATGSIAFREAANTGEALCDASYVTAPSDWPFLTVANPALAAGVAWTAKGQPQGGAVTPNPPVFFNGKFFWSASPRDNYGSGSGKALTIYAGDGISSVWTPVVVAPATAPAGQGIFKLLVFNGRLYALSNTALFVTSNGQDWTVALTANLSDLHASPGCLFVLGTHRQVGDYYSLDGVTFVKPTNWPNNGNGNYRTTMVTLHPVTGVVAINQTAPDGDGITHGYSWTAPSLTGVFSGGGESYTSGYTFLKWFLDRWYAANGGNNVLVGTQDGIYSSGGANNTDNNVCPPDVAGGMLVTVNRTGVIYYQTEAFTNNLQTVSPVAFNSARSPIVGCAAGNDLLLIAASDGYAYTVPWKVDKGALPNLPSRLGKNGKRQYPYMKVA